MPSVAAIVVNYRRPDLLGPCLGSLERALARAGGGELIVVDNGSGDGSVDLVRDRFPGVRLVALPENRGFGAGVNAGLRHSSSEWVFLMNNDATAEADALAELLRVATSAPDIGSVAGQLRFAVRADMINSAGLEIDRLGIGYDRLVGAPISASEDRPVEVFGTSAGAALYRRAALDDVGGFDEHFFLFGEDADVAWRARMRGWRSLYAPRAVVHHHHSGSAIHHSSLKHFYVGRNRVRLLARNADGRLLLRYGAAMAAYDLAYVAFVAVRARSLAPLRGRLAGLREWREARRAGAALRRPVALAPVSGFRAALRRNRAWALGGTGGPLRSPSPHSPERTPAPGGR